MQHKYIHIGLYNRALNYEDYQEVSASEFIYKQGVKWGLDMSNLENLYKESLKVKFPQRYHYSRFGIQILDTTPW